MTTAFMLDLTGGFNAYQTVIRPQYSRKHKTVLLWPPGTASYYGTPGDIMDYDNGYGGQDALNTYMVVDVPDEFHAELRPVAFEGGRSAANIRFTDMNRPYTYLMPAAEAVSMIAKTSRNGGVCVGAFSLGKRGANIRLKLVDQYETL